MVWEGWQKECDCECEVFARCVHVCACMKCGTGKGVNYRQINLLALPQHQHTMGQRKLVCWCWGRAKRLTLPSKNPKNHTDKLFLFAEVWFELFYEERFKRVEFGLSPRCSQDRKLFPVIRVEAANVCNQMLANCWVGCLAFLFLLLLLFLVVLLFLLLCCLFLCFLAWLKDVRRNVLLDPSLQPLDGLPYIPATAPALKVVDNVRFIMDREGILEARWKSRLGNKTNSRAASWVSRFCGLKNELFKRLWPVITNPW